jgi:hypothetical protein
VGLVQIQQEERLALTAKSSWVEALIKGEYSVKRDGDVTACWRGRKRNACAKRVEVQKRFIVRGIVRI